MSLLERGRCRAHQRLEAGLHQQTVANADDESKSQCNREWPCNRCHARKVPHLCQFGGSTTAARHRLARARRLHCKPEGSEVEALEAHVDAAVRTLGSDAQPGHRQWAAVVLEQPPSTEAASTDLQSALDLLYSSEFAGLLVQHFLYRGHYYHYILYDAQFTTEYTQWWQDRRSGRPVSAVFTCLVLRVCACAAQYLPAATRERPDMQTAFRLDSLHNLAQTLHGHAQRLSASIAPGTGGLAQVQQLMLGVVWLQHASQWTATWHALAGAIHEAQEQGMHLNSDNAGVTDFEKDMRRQAWCLLCAWDCTLLHGRPPIISPDAYPAKVPVLKLHSLVSASGSSLNDTPIPSTHMLLQYELASRVARVAREFRTAMLPWPIETAMDVVEEVCRWLDALPEAYKDGLESENDIKNTNTNENIWLEPQRAHLHSLAHTVILTVLRPFLSDTGTEGVAQQAIDAAITIVDINYALYKHLYPDCAHPNTVFSSVISASAVLCQSLGTFESTRRRDVITSISRALEMLYGLSSEIEAQAVTRTAFAALHRIALQLPLSSEERALIRHTHHRQQQHIKRSASTVPDVAVSLPLFFQDANTNDYQYPPPTSYPYFLPYDSNDRNGGALLHTDPPPLSLAQAPPMDGLGLDGHEFGGLSMGGVAWPLADMTAGISGMSGGPPFLEQPESAVMWRP